MYGPKEHKVFYCLVLVTVLLGYNPVEYLKGVHNECSEEVSSQIHVAD